MPLGFVTGSGGLPSKRCRGKSTSYVLLLKGHPMLIQPERLAGSHATKMPVVIWWSASNFAIRAVAEGSRTYALWREPWHLSNKSRFAPRPEATALVPSSNANRADLLRPVRIMLRNPIQIGR